MTELFSLLSVVLYWVCVIGTCKMAEHRGRNRAGWTILALFVPLVALVIVSCLPDRKRARPLAPAGVVTANGLEHRKAKRA